MSVATPESEGRYVRLVLVGQIQQRLAARHPEIAQRLRPLLAAWEASVNTRR